MDQRHPVMLVPFLAAAGLALSSVFVILPFNGRLFLAVNGGNHPLLDPVALTVTMFGDGLVLGLILLAWARRSPSVTLAGLAALSLAGIATQLLKFSADVPRPGAVIPGVHLIGPELLARSFPSGHSAAAFAVAGVLVLRAPAVARALFPLAAAALVAWSRVYVGVHFPADAAMGAFLGLSGAGLVTAALGGAEGRLDRWALRRPKALSLAAAALYAGDAAWLFLAYPALPGQARLPLAIFAAALVPALFCGYSRISRR